MVIQGDALNRSRVSAVVCVPLTSNLKRQAAPGNVLLLAKQTGLPKNSVTNVAQIITLDKPLLTERAGKLPRAKLDVILAGVDVVFGPVANSFE